MTNGDRIRQMSNEELAFYLKSKLGTLGCNICVYDEDECLCECVKGIKAYLESEAK